MSDARAPAAEPEPRADADAVPSPRADESSWGFPKFARDFPRDPELDALVAAFARGDYLTVRQRAPELAARTTDGEIQRAATLLRQRIEPDPSARILFVIAAGLLVVLTSYWILHGSH